MIRTHAQQGEVWQLRRGRTEGVRAVQAVGKLGRIDEGTYTLDPVSSWGLQCRVGPQQSAPFSYFSANTKLGRRAPRREGRQVHILSSACFFPETFSLALILI